MMSRLPLLAAFAVSLAAFVSAEPEVLSMPIRRDAFRHHRALTKRRLAKRDPFSVNLDGYIYQGGFYLVNVTVGYVFARF
jgi:hypothetical protein